MSDLTFNKVAGAVLATAPAAVVHDGGHPIALITQSDLGLRSSR